jgi:hypothetical protein
MLLLPALGLAQDETPTTPAVDPDKVAALLVFLGGGIVTTIVELLKKVTKATGILAVLITGFVAVAGTAIYFVFIDPMTPAWNWLSFALYALVIFGEATGFYHIYQRRTTTT